MAKKIATTVYITEDQQNFLKELNRRTKVPIAEFIREGIDLVLDRNRALLPGQLEFGDNEASPTSSLQVAVADQGLPPGVVQPANSQEI